MMKPHHASAFALALCLAACAGFDQTVNNAVAWIDAPATQQAIGSLKSGVTAFTCAVADASAVAKEIEFGRRRRTVADRHRRQGLCRIGNGLRSSWRNPGSAGGRPVSAAFAAARGRAAIPDA